MAPASPRRGDGHPSRAPPPTPIATGKGSRSAAVDDRVLTEYLERSLRVPDLTLPESCPHTPILLRRRRTPAVIDLTSLLLGDEASAARLLASAAEVGAFRIDGHDVSDMDVRGVVEAVAGVFEVAVGERGELGRCFRRRAGAREEFRWFRPARPEDEAAVLGVWPGSYSTFREKAEIVCTKLERIAESLGAILSVKMGAPLQRHGGPEGGPPPAVLCLRKYSFQLFGDPSFSGDAAGEVTARETHPHALSLHLLGGNREFVIQSDEGSVPFPVPSGSIVVTLSREFQELSNGGVKGVHGEPIFELSSDLGPSFSVEYMCFPRSLDHRIKEKNERCISLMDQLLMALVFTLLYKLWTWAFSG